MICNCSRENYEVVQFLRVVHKSGITDIQIRREKERFRVIDHSCNHDARDGKGINWFMSDVWQADKTAQQFARYLIGYGDTFV